MNPNTQMNEDYKSLLTAGAIGLASLTGTDAIAKDINKNNRESEQIVKTDDKKYHYTFDDLVDAILYHEGVIPFQTPLKYSTDPTLRAKMMKWNTVHGCEVDKTIKKGNRKNFFFLKRQEDVPLVVKRQFIKYVTNPSQFSLPKNATIGQLIRYFDQSGADGKIKFLRDELDGFDENELASRIITSDYIEKYKPSTNESKFNAYIETLLEEYKS